MGKAVFQTKSKILSEGVKYKLAIRTCLMCGKEFDSAGVANRRCDPCKFKHAILLKNFSDDSIHEDLRTRMRRISNAQR